MGDWGTTQLLALALMWVLIIFIFFAAVYFPQRKRLRAHSDFLASLRAGDKIVTAGGLYGTIMALHIETIELELAAGVVIRVAKAAIRRRQEVQPGPGQ
jgi:preprotein translocase subunit YajC